MYGAPSASRTTGASLPTGIVARPATRTAVLARRRPSTCNRHRTARRSRGTAGRRSVSLGVAGHRRRRFMPDPEVPGEGCPRSFQAADRQRWCRPCLRRRSGRLRQQRQRRLELARSAAVRAPRPRLGAEGGDAGRLGRDCRVGRGCSVAWLGGGGLARGAPAALGGRRAAPARAGRAAAPRRSRARSCWRSYSRKAKCRSVAEIDADQAEMHLGLQGGLVRCPGHLGGVLLQLPVDLFDQREPKALMAPAGAVLAADLVAEPVLHGFDARRGVRHDHRVP